MTQIKISKDKIIAGEYNDQYEIPSTELPEHLGSNLIIDEGVTFERIFQLIIENKDIFNIVFKSATGGFSIDLFINDFNKSPISEKNDSNIEYLEVSRVFNHYIYFDDSVEVEFYTQFHGLGKWEEDDTDLGGYSLELSPLNRYKHLPIKLNNSVDLKIDSGDRLLDYNERFNTILTADFSITLYEFINAILNEITFMGSPDNRDKKREELNAMSIEIDEKLKKGEKVGYEMLTDEDGDMYIDKDGKREYLFNKDKNENT